MAVDPNIPSVPSTVPTDQAPWFTAVKGCIEILMGQGRNTDANRALRVSEYKSGISSLSDLISETSSSTTTTPGASEDTPDAPANLVVVKGVWGHHLSWDIPTDEEKLINSIEVWVAINSQLRDNALLRGIVTVTDDMRGGKGYFDFSDFFVSDDVTYWIRSLSYAGNHSEWEPSDDQGGYVVQGTETLDEMITNILSILTGSITQDQLYTDLSTEIDLIGDHTSSISIISDTIDDIKSEYTVRVQTRTDDGKLVIAGIGAIADALTEQSEIIILADTFKVVIPSGEGTPIVPFVTGMVDGEATVGVNGNLVVDDTILARHIKAGEIVAEHLSSTEIFTNNMSIGASAAGFINIEGTGNLFINTSEDGKGLLIGDFANGAGWLMNNKGLLNYNNGMQVHCFWDQDANLAWQQSTTLADYIPIEADFTIPGGSVVLGLYNYKNALGEPHGGLCWHQGERKLFIRGATVTDSVLDWSNIGPSIDRPQDRATVGAEWGDNIANQPTTLADISAEDAADLATAKTNAESAVLDAATALGYLNEWASDGWFSMAEKKAFRPGFEIRCLEYQEQKEAATNLSLSTSNLTTTLTAWGTYLNGGTSWTIPTATVLTSAMMPSWIQDANLDTKQAITRTTFETKSTDYFAALVAIKKAIYIKLNSNVSTAATKAIWSLVTGTGKPSDNADVTQTALNLGASIDNAKANGSTLISGGYIRTSLIKTDAIVIGDLSGASTFTAYNTNRVNGTAASTVVSNAAAGATFTSTTWANALIGKAKLDATIIDGGYIKTDLISLNTLFANQVITGNLSFSGGSSAIQMSGASSQIKMSGLYSQIAFYGTSQYISGGLTDLTMTSGGSRIDIKKNYITLSSDQKRLELYLGYLRPTSDHQCSLGYSNRNYWDLYATNIYDGGILQDSQDDLVVLNGIKARTLTIENKDTKEIPTVSDIHEKSGMEYIDLLSLPQWMTNYDSLKQEFFAENGDLVTDADFDEWIADQNEMGYRLKRNLNHYTDLVSGGVRQLDSEMIGMFDLIASRVTALEKQIVELTKTEITEKI